MDVSVTKYLLVGNVIRSHDGEYVAELIGSDPEALRQLLIAANVPAGYKLVPIEPTDEMLDNVDVEVGGSCYSCSKWTASERDCRAVWAQMLEVLP